MGIDNLPRLGDHLHNPQQTGIGNVPCGTLVVGCTGATTGARHAVPHRVAGTEGPNFSSLVSMALALRYIGRGLTNKDVPKISYRVGSHWGPSHRGHVAGNLRRTSSPLSIPRPRVHARWHDQGSTRAVSRERHAPDSRPGSVILDHCLDTACTWCATGY